MTNRMQALQEYLDEDGLLIPGVKSEKHPEGKDYTIASPSIEDGTRLTAFAEFSGKIAAAEKRRADTGQETSPEVTAADVERLMSADDRDFQSLVLGAAFEDMKADGVPWKRVQRITEYAFATFVFGEDQADKMIAQRVTEGKAVAPTNRAARRGSKTTPSTRKARTGNAGSSR